MDYFKMLAILALAAAPVGLAGCEREPDPPVTLERNMDVKIEDGRVEVDGEIKQDTDGDGKVDRTIQITE